MRRNYLTCIVACALATGMVGLASAQSTSIAFVTKSNTLSGTVTHYNSAGDVIDEAQISPQDQSMTDSNGTDSENASTSSGVALGISVYSLTNAQNATAGSDGSGNDRSQATAKASTINYLGGLVDITTQTTTLNGVADSSNASQVDITDAEADVSTVVGSGVTVARGTYTGGTSFAVSGSVSVPVLNAQGAPTSTTQTETFTGHLIVAQIEHGTDPATGNAALAFSSEELTGQVSDGAGGYYQITLGAPPTLTAPVTGQVTYVIQSPAQFKVAG